MMAGKFLSLEEAARRLGVSIDEVNRLVDRKELFPMRDGATIKFKVDEIERVAADLGVGAAADDDDLALELSAPGLGASLSSPGSGGSGGELALDEAVDEESIFTGDGGGVAGSQTVVRGGAPALGSGTFDVDDLALESIVGASSPSLGGAASPPADSGTLAIDLSNIGGSVVGGSPFRVLSKDLTVQQGVPAVVELDLSRDVDRSQGASASFVFRPSPAAAADGVAFDGEPQVTFTYTADRTLPEDQWKPDHLPAEVRGKETRFYAAPGQASSPQWTFKGPNGAVEREEGLVVSHAFPVAGKWDCEFSCISESGVKRSRPADPIEIVDAAFAISPAQASIGMDEPATFKIVPASSATSAANYECRLDGQEIPLGPDGRTITVPPGNMAQIGRHTLAVVAKSRVGGFEWRSDAAISVKASPRVGIMPTEFVEGLDAVPVTIQAAGDIGEAVIVLANGRIVDEYPVFYPSTDVQVAQVEATIPTADITKPELDIIVRPKKEGACPDARATLKGRAADVHAKLKSPTSGSKISARGGRSIVLEPAGDNAADVGDIDFEVALATSGEEPKESGLLADEANRWTVTSPRRSLLGKTDVYAKPSGGRLRPDLFPKENKGWKKIGMLEVVPEAQWISFLLSLLGILGVLYFAWTALGKNEARHWIVQTTLRDPGPAADDGKFDVSTRLRKRARSISVALNSESQLQPYAGWPLRNWLPRLPHNFLWLNDIGSKDTTMFLWQLADKHDAKWLKKAIASNPNLPITVRGGRKQQPFAGLPDNTINGQPWETTSGGSAFSGAHAYYSKTYRLRWLGSPEGPSLWMRVKQPHGKFYWEHWVMGALGLISVPLIAYLLRLFHAFCHQY
ncbi:MAG: DNA-binding protein, partial [Planctomycetia bacterium]|nr:DNA-binding protein [Planctomycetia bacterium]